MDKRLLSERGICTKYIAPAIVGPLGLRAGAPADLRHHPNTTLTLLQGSLSEIILGCRIADPNRARILDVIEPRWSGARVLQAEKDDRRFALTFTAV